MVGSNPVSARNLHKIFSSLRFAEINMAEMSQSVRSPEQSPNPTPGLACELDPDPFFPPPGSQSIDEILAEARSHLRRLAPKEAFTILTSSDDDIPSILVDIRPAAQRREEGSIEGAIILERNVLEWRMDPRSTSKLPLVDRYDMKVIVFCSEGYTSSLAARSLQELGLHNATDIVGGFKAWRKGGLGGIRSGMPLLRV